MKLPSLDDLRVLYPTFGFGVYALKPGGPVTLEVHDETGDFYSFGGATLEAAIAEAFPKDVIEDELAGDEPEPAHDLFA